jgi:hypothetical protein
VFLALAVAVAIAALPLLGTAVGASAAGASDISVNVDDGSTATPAPSAAPGATGGAGSGTEQSGGSGQGSSGGSQGGSGSQGGAGQAVGGSGTSAETPASAPGKPLQVLVSGLRIENASSFNPLAGVIVAAVSVTNLSDQPITATAKFSVNNMLGIGVAASQQVIALQPGQQVVASASMDGLWQSGVMTASATVTPPQVIDGVKQKPILRDGWILLIPWALLAALALGAGGWALYRRLRAAR